MDTRSQTKKQTQEDRDRDTKDKKNSGRYSKIGATADDDDLEISQAKEQIKKKQELLEQKRLQQEQIEIAKLMEQEPGFGTGESSTLRVGQDDQPKYTPTKEQTARRANKLRFGKQLLGTIQNGDIRKDLAQKLARGIAKPYKGGVEKVAFTAEDFQSYVIKAYGLEAADQSFKEYLRNFFVRTAKKPKVPIFKKIAKDQLSIRQNSMYRMALKVAKIIKSRIEMANINLRNLNSAYFEKRSKIAAAAKTGSLNFFVNKLVGYQEKYNTTNASDVSKAVQRKITAGAQLNAKRVSTNILGFGTALSSFGDEPYKQYKAIYDANKESSDTSSAAVESITNQLLS